MKIVIISDIHGNLEALNKVFEDIEGIKPDIIVCLGDIIGYGPNPNECLDILLKKENIVFLKGNHEDIWIDKIDLNNCSDLGKASAIYTKTIVDKKYEKSIKLFMDEFKIENYGFYHTPPNKFLKYPYLNKIEDILDAFEYVKTNVNFYGHTHRPRITEVVGKKITDFMVDENICIKLQKNKKYYINVGSVGQQRDRKTDASYAILEILENEILLKLNRIEYDSYSTYCKIKEIMKDDNIANYLIRETERRLVYENSYNRS